VGSNETARYTDRGDSGDRDASGDGSANGVTNGVTNGATSVGRRGFLRAGVIAAAGLALSRRVLAEPVKAAARMAGSRGPDDEMIDAVRQLLKAKFGDRKIQYGHVQFDIPADAPDGRAVPAIMDIDLPITPDSYVSAYYLMVDHNPDICLATYHLTAASGEGPIETRIKMRRTSYVRAIAEMNTGELWSAAVKVFVGLNGCG
jgi:sulfur-oxidizing protein SoxY